MIQLAYMQVRRKPAIIRPASPVALVVGLATKTCVESTARYAVEMGYHTTLLTGAAATFSHEEHKAAIEFDYPRIAHVVSTVNEFLASVE
ncbi:MAG TPA: isochorismatase family protein [Alphaproteobacteria bacterium]|nr:isochorismatase family protein [Alphaproteobacteria bacterium]